MPDRFALAPPASVSAGLPTGVGLTALLVAQARAHESQRRDRFFDDPLAAAFVAAAGPALGRAAAVPSVSRAPAVSASSGASADPSPSGATDGSASSSTPAAPAATQQAIHQWRADYVAVRTRFCDTFLLDASAAGCRQVVLLAAGLDTRAFRLLWPDGVRLLELDVPDVLAFKQRVLASLTNGAASDACQRIVVPADLREDWPSALRAAGFRSSEPTAWLIEGLLMYLTEAQRDALLDHVGQLSSPGSRLALDHRPGFFATPPVPLAPPPSATPQPHATAGDPSLPSPHEPLPPSLTEPAAWLARHGWHAQVHDPVDLFAAYGRPLPPPLDPGAAGPLRGWLAAAERLTARVAAR